jgi:hypothetical protein
LHKGGVRLACFSQMHTAPDFTDTERSIVEQTVKERFGKPVEIQTADSEIRLFPDDRELTEVPVLYWAERDCHFVVFKTGESKFRNQFFYSPRDQYGTGREEYDDIFDCVITLLRVQADHEAQRAGH